MKAAFLALTLATTLGAAAFLTGCEDSIHRGWLVDRTRVLGVSVTAATDPTLASLTPGEQGRLTWLVASPEKAPALSWTFAACAAPPGNFAEPRCETPVVASASGTSTGELVAMDLAVPSQVALASSQELLVLAAFCADGLPALDARAFVATCTSGEALLASTIVRLASAGPNANPPSPAVKLGGVVLQEDDTAEAGAMCDTTPAAPRWAEGSDAVELVYTFDGREREPGETILLSTIVTDGALDRQYSVFDPDDVAPKEIRVTWTPPPLGSVPPTVGGRVVRLYVLLRDGRGGTSFGRFALCVDGK